MLEGNASARGPGEVANREDAAPVPSGGGINLRIVLFDEPRRTDHNVRTAFDRRKHVRFGRIRLRVLDEHITAGRERFRSRGVDRAGDPCVTEHLAEVAPRIGARHGRNEADV
jgi:hypothetical protein